MPPQEDVGPACGVSIAKRAAETLELFSDASLHVLFMLKNGASLEPATVKDAEKFDQSNGWGMKGTTLVDAEIAGRETYFGGDEVGTMLLSPGFVIQAINKHDFATELLAILKSSGSDEE